MNGYCFRRCGCGRSALLWTLLLGASVSGCLRAQARTTPTPKAPPPLDMPAPPPRLIEPSDASAPQTVPLVEEPARNTPPRSRQAVPAQPKAELAKPDPRKVEPPVEALKPADESPKVQPPTTLQTTPAGTEAQVERRIRGLLSHATNDLNRIDYRALNADARTQYDTAKRFVSQAEEALRAKNLMFASNLADKAAVLAAQLAGK